MHKFLVVKWSKLMTLYLHSFHSSSCSPAAFNRPRVRFIQLSTKYNTYRVSTDPAQLWKKIQACRSREICCWSCKSPDFWSVRSWKNNLASTFVAMHLLLLVYHTTISVSSLNRATNGILSQMIYVIVRPLSTVEYTSVASLFHCRQWSD